MSQSRFSRSRRLPPFLPLLDSPADLLLLETGLGGRLDATNVLRKPAVTAITPVSIDHVSFLGHTIPAIAGRKLESSKPGVPCVVARQTAEALRVIEATANEIGAPLHVFGRDFDAFERDRKLIFQTPTKMLGFPAPRLKGGHQIRQRWNGHSNCRSCCLEDLGLMPFDVV